LGLSAYVTNFGPKRVALSLAHEVEARAKGSEHEATVHRLVEILQSDEIWGWKSSDGDTLQSGASQRSAESAQRALLAVARALEIVDSSYHLEAASLSTKRGLDDLFDRLSVKGR
jgi:hypothetical protein